MALDPTELDIIVAALLKFEGKTQKQTAELLGVSQSKIHDYLKLASSYVSQVCEPEWKKEAPTNDEWEIIKARKLPGLKDFEKTLNLIAKKRNLPAPSTIKVIHASASGSDMRPFGRVAVSHIAPFIRKSRLCAVAWGKTLDSVVSELGSRQGYSRLRFIPVSGQPLNSNEPGSSPSGLVDRLCDIYDIKSDKRMTLHGVPARIPKKLYKESKTLRKFINHCDDYIEIFGEKEDGSDGLIAKVELILSGIGDAKSSQGDPWYQDVKKLEGGQQLPIFALGNIGGIWLPTESATPHQVAKVEDINSRSFGIKWHHFRDCAQRANRKNSESVGVVVVAREAGKAEILIRTVGLVNHYVITSDLYDACRRILGLI